MSKRIQLKVIRKKQETKQAVSIYLESMGPELAYLPGQFITFIFEKLGPLQIRRSYSLSSAPGINKHLIITVKRVANGIVSRFFTEKIKKGHVLNALAPAGQFSYSAQNKHRRTIFLIGGGSGITPLYSILKTACQYEIQSRIVLINANRNESETIFYQDLRKLARKYPSRLHIIHLWTAFHFNDKASYHRLENMVVLKNRLSNELLENLVRKYRQKNRDQNIFYLCGPPGLMLKSENTLGFMGFRKEQIKREIFIVKKRLQPKISELRNCQVQLIFAEKTFEFKLRAGQTILEAARLAGIELPYSCQSGICTTCSAQCVSGGVEMYGQEGKLDSNQTNGLVMTCVGYPSSPELVLDFDQ